MAAPLAAGAGSWRPTPVAAAILGVGVIIAAALVYANRPGRGPGAHSWKPSFDCRLASGKTELMICNNEQLAQLDNELSVLYYTIRKSLSGDDQRQLDSAESVWVAERNTCVSDFNCIKKMYQGSHRRAEDKDGGASPDCAASPLRQGPLPHHLHCQPGRGQRGLLRPFDLHADLISRLPFPRRAGRERAQREMSAHPASRWDGADEAHAVEAVIHAMGGALDFWAARYRPWPRAGRG